MPFCYRNYPYEFPFFNDGSSMVDLLSPILPTSIVHLLLADVHSSSTAL